MLSREARGMSMAADDWQSFWLENVFHSHRFVICALVGGHRHKLLSIRFEPEGASRRLHSLQVDFPYCGTDTAFVGTYSQRDDGHMEIDARPGSRSGMNTGICPPMSGKTSTIPKFTYHADGNIHFSQDGRVYTSVRLVNAPLTECQTPHLMFTAVVAGIDMFVPTTPAEEARSGTSLRFLDVWPQTLRFGDTLRLDGWFCPVDYFMAAQPDQTQALRRVREPAYIPMFNAHGGDSLDYLMAPASCYLPVWLPMLQLTVTPTALRYPRPRPFLQMITGLGLKPGQDASERKSYLMLTIPYVPTPQLESIFESIDYPIGQSRHVPAK